MNPSPEPLQWTPELIDRFWSGVADTRLAELSFGRLNGDKLLDIVEPHLSPKARHLDFGAGDGDVLRRMLARGYPTAGYEIAEGRLERLLAHDVARDPNFLGGVGPETRESFDVLLMLDVIEHVIDEQERQTFDAIRRLLRRGGTLIVSTPHREDLDLGVVYCPISNKTFHRWQHVRSFTAEALERFLDARGFDRVHVHRVDFSDVAMRHHRLKAVEARNAALERRFLRGRMRGVWEALLCRALPGYPDSPLRSPSQDLRFGDETHLVYVGRAR